MNSSFITSRPGREVITLFTCSTHLSMESAIIINKTKNPITNYVMFLLNTADNVICPDNKF